MSRAADIRDTVPTPRTIGGVVMQPFCLGHHLLLKKLGMPYAGNAAADCGADEILIGVAICGLTYEDATLAVSHGGLADIMARWRKAVAGPWWNPNELDLVEVEAQFREYLADGYSLPPLWRHEGKGFEMTAPWEQLLKVRLTMAGFSEQEVLNGYLPARWYDYFTALELEQASRIADPKDFRKVFFTPEDAQRLQ